MPLGDNGKELERINLDFFKRFLPKCGFTVHKARTQNSGTQDGYDNLLVVIDEYYRRFHVYIECKDYSNKVSFSESVIKIMQLQSTFGKIDLIIFVSPFQEFTNPFDDDRLDKFYKKNNIPIEFLTPDNNIIEYYATDKDIYKAIYEKDCELRVDENRKIEDFKRFLYSTEPLKIKKIKEEEKETYIGKVQEKENYITRTISKDLQSTDWDLINEELGIQVDKFTLIKGIESLFEDRENLSDGIILLGNPGQGKTEELQQTALNLWEKNKEKITPFYRSLRSFTLTSTIENFLPQGWKYFPQLVVIYDGLDEMKEIGEFQSKLENFIINCQSENQKIKFVISCRTNIFQNQVTKNNFEVFYLNDIPFSKALDYLKKECRFTLESYSQFVFNQEQTDFLKNPFYLILFGDYYKRYKTLPTNNFVLIESFIKQRLEKDWEDKFQKSIDKSVIRNICKKIAFFLESTGQREISDTRLHSVVEIDEKNTFKECSFVEIINDETSMFTHKNIQEYFVASVLKGLNYDEILEIIKIKEINKIHPAWLNSVSYLLNALEKSSEIYNELITWIVNNDSDILFNLDSDRIELSTRITVFQNYFTKVCKEQTLWISDRQKTATFGDCKENAQFLLQQIQDHTNHHRTIKSAFYLISYMKNSTAALETEIKSEIQKYIAENVQKQEYGNMTFILEIIRNLNYGNQKEYIHKIISDLKEIDTQNVINGIFYLIENHEEIDEFKDYINDAGKRLTGEVNRKCVNIGEPNTIRGRQQLVRLLKKYKILENILESLRVFITHRYILQTEKKDIDEIYDKLIEIYQESMDKELFISEISSIIFVADYDFHQIIEKIIKKLKLEDEVVAKIYPDFDKSKRFLSCLLSLKTISLIVEDYKKGKRTQEDINYIRNGLYRDNQLELSKSFQEQMINVGFSFENDIIDINAKEKIVQEKRQNIYENSYQKNFNILFNKEKIHEQIRQIFIDIIGKKEIDDKDWENFDEIYWKDLDYQKLFLQRVINIVRHNISYHYDEKTYLTLNEILSRIDNTYLIAEIQEELYRSKPPEVSEKQKEFIHNWFDENIVKADFVNDTDEYSIKTSKMLWFFFDKYKFKVGEDIILNMLSFKEVEASYDELFEYIQQQVTKEKFENRIILNLKNGTEKVYNNWYQKQIEYCLDNNLVQAYEYIKRDIQENKLSPDLFEKYIEVTQDIDFLKKLANTLTIYSNEWNANWKAIDLLIKNRVNDFVNDILLKLYDKTGNSEISLGLHKEMILKYLIEANYKGSILLLNERLEDNLNFETYSNTFYQFNNIEALLDAIKLLENEYLIPDYKESPYKIGYMAQMVLTNICRNTDPEKCLEIKKQIGESQERMLKINKDIDIFYYSNTLKDIDKIYYDKISKPLNDQDAKSKIEKLKEKNILF